MGPTRLSTESLEALLFAVGIFGAIYNPPGAPWGTIQKFKPRVGAKERMRMAVEMIAAVQAGGDFPAWRFNNPLPAFTTEFRDCLAVADLYENWAASLNERQLYTLLWQIGEYGIRVSFGEIEQEPYLLPVLEIAPSRRDLMWKALCVLVALERGHAMNVCEARKQVLGESV